MLPKIILITCICGYRSQHRGVTQANTGAINVERLARGVAQDNAGAINAERLSHKCRAASTGESPRPIQVP